MNELYKKPNLSPNEGIFSDVETAFDFSLIEVKDEKVNARGLHKFLGNKREFATWIKDRLTDFDEGIDFDKIVKPHENNKKEYFLTVDTAKHLAMIERTQQGKQARKYFIECEKKLKQPKKLTTADILSLATKELSRLNQIVIEKVESVPTKKMRIVINKIVKDYAVKTKNFYQIIWNRLYKEFKDVYSIDLTKRVNNAKKKGLKKSKIDIAEELGKLEELYNLSLKMFEVEN